MTSFLRFAQARAQRFTLNREIRPWIVGVLLGIIFFLQLGLVLWVIVKQ